MIIDYFDSRFLTGVVNRRPPRHDLFATFFKPQTPKPTELFELHVKSRQAVMVPAITNHAPGVMMQGRTVEAGVVKAPRFRTKRLFKAADMLKVAAGTTPYNPQVDPVEQAIAEDMDDHRDDIDRMTEILCAQAAVYGQITLMDVVEGVTVPTFNVDFKRPAGHTIQLVDNARWSAAESDLLGQIEHAGLLIQDDTGFAPTDLLLGKEAWKLFRRHKDVRDDLDNKGLDLGGLAPRVGKKLKGVWNGLNIWTVAGGYADLDGVIKPYLDDKDALLLTAQAESVIEYGQPIDAKCTGPVEFFAKAFEQEDPSGVFTIAESRPLPWAKQPGWTVRMTVL